MSRIDAYIEKQAPFAQIILKYWRELVYSTNLEISEEIKWQFPCFMYKGKILCHMAGFKQHCAFGFWLHSYMLELQDEIDKTAMGQFGKIKNISDLPSEEQIRKYIFQAAQLIDEGKTITRKSSTEKAELVVPKEMINALKKEKNAWLQFQSMSYSHQKEWIEYYSNAKREETKISRLKKMVEKLMANESLNSKYEKK